MADSIGFHLIYASIVAITAWVLTSTERGSASAKYWIWVIATFNFAVPLSLLPDSLWPAQISWFTSNVAPRLWREIAFLTPATALRLWILGATVMLVRLCWRLRGELRSGQRVGTTLFTINGVPVRTIVADCPPFAGGILRPFIALPTAVDRMLGTRELEAVLLHEARHAGRRDNLIRLLHELCLCAFWFHPLLWIAGRRLALYRELSCDEAVTERNDLLTALAKLVECSDPSLLQAGAASFVSRRLHHLRSPRSSRTATALMAAIFALVVAIAAVAPAARGAAAKLCPGTQHQRASS